MIIRRWRVFCCRPSAGLCLTGELCQRLHFFSLIAALILCSGGCGFLSSQRENDSSGYLTRGQQPLTATTREQSEDAQQIIQRARGLYAEGQLEKAKKVLSKALHADPASTHALELESRIALDLGDMDAYRAALKKTLTVNPDSAAAQNRTGKRLVESGSWDEGVHALSKAYELEPQTVAYARDLAAACLERSDNTLAVDVLTQAIRWNPGDATIPVALARYHEAAENWQEAARYYDVAMKSDSENQLFLRQKARCLYRMGEFAKACDLYSACIESNTSSVALSEYAEYGDACLRIGDIERAQMVYDRISRYSPVRSREVEILRVICAVRRGDSQRAQRILRDALVLWPNDEDLREMRDSVESGSDEVEAPDSL